MQGDELRILRTAGELASLADEWTDLARRSPGFFCSQTFPWIRTAWDLIAAPRGRALQCLTLRSQGKLVGV